MRSYQSWYRSPAPTVFLLEHTVIVLFWQSIALEPGRPILPEQHIVMGHEWPIKQSETLVHSMGRNPRDIMDLTCGRYFFTKLVRLKRYSEIDDHSPRLALLCKHSGACIPGALLQARAVVWQL